MSATSLACARHPIYALHAILLAFKLRFLLSTLAGSCSSPPERARFFARRSLSLGVRPGFRKGGSRVGDFEIDTRVEGERGRYRATLSEDWRIWGPNGGYLASIALRAAGREAQIARPASIHAHFLSVGRFAEVEIEVETVRGGKRSESLRVKILQEGKQLLEALVRTAAAGPGLEHDVAKCPDVPRPGALENIEQLVAKLPVQQQQRFPFWQNLESRPVWPERVGQEPQPRPPLWREWYRFRPRDRFDDPWTDAARMLVLIDTMTWPAAVQPHGPQTKFTAPNLDVTAWFHRSALGEPWLLADHACDVAEAALMGTTSRVWSESGRLLASGGAQLFCIAAP
jgi:acyl-CoA thioesterase II